MFRNLQNKLFYKIILDKDTSSPLYKHMAAVLTLPSPFLDNVKNFLVFLVDLAANILVIFFHQCFFLCLLSFFVSPSSTFLIEGLQICPPLIYNNNNNCRFYCYCDTSYNISYHKTNIHNTLGFILILLFHEVLIKQSLAIRYCRILIG